MNETGTDEMRSFAERVPAEQWEQVNAEVHAAVRQYVDGGSVKFGAVVVLAAGSH